MGPSRAPGDESQPIARQHKALVIPSPGLSFALHPAQLALIVIPCSATVAVVERPPPLFTGLICTE